MATTISSAALVPVTSVFTNTERLALAGFLAGYCALTRQAYELDLRQYVAWCQQHLLRRSRKGARSGTWRARPTGTAAKAAISELAIRARRTGAVSCRVVPSADGSAYVPDHGRGRRRPGREADHARGGAARRRMPAARLTARKKVGVGSQELAVCGIFLVVSLPLSTRPGRTPDRDRSHPGCCA
jgi:hypothetical protein